MAKLGINTGSTPNDGTGDTLLAAALKINQNFDEIYNTFGDGSELSVVNYAEVASYASTSGISTYSVIAGYAHTAGISTVSQGLIGIPNINVGIITAAKFNLTEGEIRVGFNSDFVLSLEDVEGSPTYTFGANGALYLPGNLEIGSDGYVLFNNLGSKLQSDPNYDFEIHVGGFANKVWAFSTDGSTTLPYGTKIVDIGSSAGAYPTSGLALGNNGFQVSFGSTINDWAIFNGSRLIQFESDENINIIAGNSVNITGGGIEGPQWQFNSNGTITFPDNTVQTTAYTGSSVGSGVTVRDGGGDLGIAKIIDFGNNLTLSPVSAGVVTVTGAAAGGGSGESYWASTNAGIHTLSNVGVGTTNPRTPLQIKNVYGIDTGSGTFSPTPGVAYAATSWTISSTDFKTAEYTLWFQHTSGIQSQKILIMNNGTSAYYEEYAIMHSNSPLVSVGATIESGSVKLLWTPESGVTGVVTFRFTRETML